MRHRSPWNDDQKKRLIALAKQYEVLWRRFPNNNNTRIVALRRSALLKVQQHFATEGFTVDDVREQWRNLRDVFYKRYELMMRRVIRGETKKMNWRFWNELKFLASEKAMGNNRRGLHYGSIELIEQHIKQQNDPNGYNSSEGQFDAADGQEREWPLANDGDMDEIGEMMLGPEEEEDSGGLAELIEVKLEDMQSGGMCADGITNNKQQLKEPATLSMPMLPQVNSSMSRLQCSIDRQISAVHQKPLTYHQEAILLDAAGVGTLLHHQIPLDRRPKQQWPHHLRSSATISRPSSVELLADGGAGTSSMIGTTEQQQKKANNNSAMAGYAAAAANSSSSCNNRPQQKEKDRLKYFGVFVETAVRDLSQQSPAVARRLMQSIYSTISNHQMEAAAMIDAAAFP